MSCRHLAEGLGTATTRRLARAPYIKEVCRVADARGQRPPGYHTVYNAIRAIPDNLKTLALDGEKAYRETYDLLYRREAEGRTRSGKPTTPNLISGPNATTGSRARPWLSVIIDDYSRADCGILLLVQQPVSVANRAGPASGDLEESRTPHWIVFGIPDVLYTDNGSDFTSAHLEQVAANIKMRLVFSAPGHPRGRGRIERSSILSIRCFFAAFLVISNVALFGQTRIDSYRSSIVAFREFLREYHARPHSETKVLPQERWQHGGFVPRMADSLEQLDLLLADGGQDTQNPGGWRPFPRHALHRSHARRLRRRDRAAALRSARHCRSAALPSGQISLSRHLP